MRTQRSEVWQSSKEKWNASLWNSNQVACETFYCGNWNNMHRQSRLTDCVSNRHTETLAPYHLTPITNHTASDCSAVSPLSFAYAQQLSDSLTSCRSLARRHPWRQPQSSIWGASELGSYIFYLISFISSYGLISYISIYGLVTYISNYGLVSYISNYGLLSSDFLLVLAWQFLEALNFYKTLFKRNTH